MGASDISGFFQLYTPDCKSCEASWALITLALGPKRVVSVCLLPVCWKVIIVIVIYVSEERNVRLGYAGIVYIHFRSK